MRVILVPVADRPECAVALETAFGLAESLSANVIGCHVRPHREEKHSPPSSRLAMMLEDGTLPKLSAETVRLNSKNARKLFEGMAAQRDISMAKTPRHEDNPLAYWNEMVGHPEKVLGIVGPVADCIVVSRAKPKGRGPARAFMLAALLDTGKPLLVLPQMKLPSIGKRILIGWDQGVRVAAAMTAALPLLKRAEQVHIVCCGGETEPGPKTSQAQGYLRHWGIESQIHREKGRDAPGELIDVYERTDADLLVMGAYSRSRLHERVLGGVTHEILFKSRLPVFALHE
ncbi:MAG: universal stress protein [Xanthomonadales bacterium]|nr:universal stress protein [Xanthomonadales bacterium]